MVRPVMGFLSDLRGDEPKLSSPRGRRFKNLRIFSNHWNGTSHLRFGGIQLRISFRLREKKSTELSEGERRTFQNPAGFFKPCFSLAPFPHFLNGAHLGVNFPSAN
jgi:hypothetical protein